MKVTTLHLKKLDDRSRRTIFVGYEPGSKAYRLYDPEARRVHISRDVVFQEQEEWRWGEEQRTAANDFTVEHMEPPTVTTTTTATSMREASASTPPASSSRSSVPPHQQCARPGHAAGARSA